MATPLQRPGLGGDGSDIKDLQRTEPDKDDSQGYAQRRDTPVTEKGAHFVIDLIDRRHHSSRSIG